MKSHQVETITSGINILPTIINLFGIDTNFIYPGYDALGTSKGYVPFRNYTYFDGIDIKPFNSQMLDDVNYSSGILVLDYYGNSKEKKENEKEKSNIYSIYRWSFK